MSNDTPGWRHSSSLMTLVSGEAIGLAEGFIPRLVRWTEEDKAARGLRSLRETHAQPQPPIHFSVLEIIQESRATLLLAETGGGKSILARHLALCLAEKRLDRLTRVVPRNDLGDVRPDGWQGAVPTPILAGPSRGCGWAIFSKAVRPAHLSCPVSSSWTKLKNLAKACRSSSTPPPRRLPPIEA